MDKESIFDEIIRSIENEDICRFAVMCLPTIPKYFWEVGASSTGKYHPEYALGTLGLARHTVALVRILNHMLSLERNQQAYTSRERDYMRVAGMMHDTRKSGDDNDFAKSKYTRFDHPLKAAEVVRNVIGLAQEEKEIIAGIIESHMGQWNFDKKTFAELPKPITKCQFMVHMADYLASRKDIEIKFE